MDLIRARSNMIEQQVRPWDVLDQRVLDVLAEVPREAFVDEHRSGVAYSDFPLPIGHGQYMFKPTLDGRLLQALALEITDHALEIGTGSGYLSACIARLAAHCETLEIVPELATSAAARLAALGIANVTARERDGAGEWDVRERYEAILLGGSVVQVPDRHRRMLAIGGRLVAVLGRADSPTMEAVVVTRVHEEEWATEGLFDTRVDPLVNFTGAPTAFVF